MTAARVQQLAAEGKLALTDHVFCSGDNSPCWLPAPMLPPSHDSRVRDITIAHLINHTGGWDRGRSGEPYGSEIEVVRNLALTRAPTRAELIRHQMARPLDAAPGASMVYSNFGYLLLAEVIERAGGEAYVAQVQRGVFAPIGVGAEEFKGARSLLADRDVREPHYVSDRMAPGVFSGGQSRLAKDEFAVLENWVSVGMALSPARTRWPASPPATGYPTASRSAQSAGTTGTRAASTAPPRCWSSWSRAPATRSSLIPRSAARIMAR
ncbi:beta-lactamase family protein [Massilia sp. H-1]|nr:beta-lactamase family protein [Massilia sp. H-1]